jgi:hypothetical protein
MKKFLLLLIVMLAVQRLSAQDSEDRTFASLFIITNGLGRVFPFHNGDMLEVGRKYEMVAVPDKHFEFSSWQPVTIFTDIEYTYNSAHQLIETESDTVVPTPEYYQDPVLHFTMEDDVVLFNIPNVRILTQNEGWQANFVPLPPKQKVICKRF